WRSWRALRMVSRPQPNRRCAWRWPKPSVSTVSAMYWRRWAPRGNESAVRRIRSRICGVTSMRMPPAKGQEAFYIQKWARQLPEPALVDDTLAHKRGQSVWGLGWFRDAVASTQKRVATASGHNWVVLAVAVCVPFTGAPILALPVLARLHLPGKGQPSCAKLAKEMLAELLAHFP